MAYGVGAVATVIQLFIRIADAILGWRSRFSGTVSIGHNTTVAWRRIRRASGNHISIGDESLIHANLIFEANGGEIRIGSRTLIGRSTLICYRSLTIGDDVLMSWGITVVDHDSHSLIWENRRDDVREWAKGRKDWQHVARAPVTIADKAWIGFNVIILKGVTIGEGAVVGAGSVVTRDIPPYSLAAGCPAKVIRSLR
jgi:acetyltransferase-like isoleucine patch superfamily enzyme